MFHSGESTVLRSNAGLTKPFTTDHVQKVETHSKVRSRLFVNSDERLVNTGYDRAQYNSGSSIIKTEVKKIALESYRIDISYPNVNSRNDTITFFSNISGTTHTVVLDSAYYTISSLITEIQAKLNSVTGSSGLTFTFTLFPGSTDTYELICAGGSYNFLSSSHIDRSASLSGLFATPSLIGPGTIMTIVAHGFYTRFIDVVIDSLKDGIHLENLFSSDNTISNTGHVYRIPVTEYTEAGVNKLFVSKDVLLPEIQFSSFRSKKLNQITVGLYDEFNELLFSPDQTIGGVTQNIKYVDYGLVFSLE